MAFDAYDDYEQSERVQKWLRQNGLSIVVGIVIGLVAIFGWQQWRSHRAGKEAEAGNLYQMAQGGALSGKTALADQFTEQLQSNFSGSPYAVFAVTDRAQRQVRDGQLDKAVDSLNWGESHASDTALKSLVQLRLAQVQLARGKADEALGVLDRLPKDAYQGLGQELRGDALVKLGRLDDARKAYQTALLAVGEDAPQRGALQLKLDDLAAAGKQGA